MSPRASILLVTWDGAGNLPPERSLARSLAERGHTVRALAHDSLRETFERSGIELLPLRGVSHYDSREPKTAEEELPFVVEQIWYARAFGSELLAAIDRHRPALLLVDVSLNYALVAARSSGLPTVVLGHMPYSLILGPFAPLFGSRLEEVNCYAAELGLAPFSTHQALVEAAPLLLVASYRPFDPVEGTSDHVVHVGPCRWVSGSGETWQRRFPQRPLVLVALSTSFQRQLPALQRLCDALGALDLEALVTTGAAIDPESLRAADNTTVARFVSHDEVLPKADLLITHAGHGTVMAGATYGVPMLCLPMGRDQPWNAERVAQLGLGQVIDPEAPVAAIAASVTAILADAGAKKRSDDFAKSIAGHPGLDDAVELVEGLL